MAPLLDPHYQVLTFCRWSVKRRLDILHAMKMTHTMQPEIDLKSQFLDRGWSQFADDTALNEWLAASREAVLGTLSAADHVQWWRYQDTWFAGVNVLGNDPTGAVGVGPPLTGKTIDFANQIGPSTPPPWDQAQVSACRPGYPQPMAEESEALFRFRRDHDAAHLDGLLKEGPQRRRFLKEFHAFILGIPATRFSADAAPFTLWEGSHHMIRQWLQETLGALPPAEWESVDLTDGYQAIRRKIFETCPRIEVPAHTGAPFLVHRFALHGMAPWGNNANADPEGRVIVYFRPLTKDLKWWLTGD